MKVYANIPGQGRQMPTSEKIPKCSFIFCGLVFLKETIFLTFWYLFLELFSAKFALQLWYIRNQSNDFTSCFNTDQLCASKVLHL
jgi:hypothetical protein